MYKECKISWLYNQWAIHEVPVMPHESSALSLHTHRQMRIFNFLLFLFRFVITLKAKHKSKYTFTKVKVWFEISGVICAKSIYDHDQKFFIAFSESKFTFITSFKVLIKLEISTWNRTSFYDRSFLNQVLTFICTCAVWLSKQSNIS